MPTVYYVSSKKLGGGYWTTDKQTIDDELQVDQEEYDGASGFEVTVTELSDEEIAELEAKSREFMGW